MNPLILDVHNTIMFISQLSYNDMLGIIVTYHNLYRDTNKQTEDDLKKRGYSQAVINSLQVETNKLSIESCGFRIKGSFDKVKYDQFAYVNHLFDCYEKGMLPFPGSVSEQPAQIMEIFSLINVLRLETKQKMIEEQKRNSARVKK